MNANTAEPLSNEIRELPVKEKLHLAAGLLGAPRADMRRMAHSIVRMALQEIEADQHAGEAQPS